MAFLNKIEQSMGEADAVAQLKQGDISGLEELVRQYYVRAVRAAFLVCHDRDAAEDIVQAAFIRAYERIHQFDADRSFGPWFMRIVVNDAHKANLKRKRDTPIEADDEIASLPSAEAALDDLIAEGETNQAIWEALGRLSPGQRSAIVMRYYLGLSDSDMSSRLDIQPGTVRWRLHVAKQRLRVLLPAWISPTPIDE